MVVGLIVGRPKIVFRLMCPGLIIWLSVISFASRSPQAGPSRDQVKKSVLDSVIFKSSDIFYPNERFGPDRKYSEMSPKQKEDLKSLLERILESASVIYAANAEKMNDYLGEELPQRLPHLVVKVIDEGSSKLSVEPSEDSSGRELLHIEIDVKLLQNSFRAGVAAAFKGNESLNPLGGEGGFFLDLERPKSGGQLTDDHLVERFLEFKKKVRKDLSKKLNDLEVSMRSIAVMTVDSRYTGLLLFGMAHEIAHYILKHSSSQDYPGCTTFQTEELEADRFASFLLTRSLTSRGVLGAAFISDFTGFLNYIGSEVFFREGYERFGIKDVSEVSSVCLHPPPKERLIATQSGMKAAFEASQKDEDDTALNALEKRIQEIQIKNLRRKRP